VNDGNLSVNYCTSIYSNSVIDDKSMCTGMQATFVTLTK